jgi:hypothetical protein
MWARRWKASLQVTHFGWTKTPVEASKVLAIEPYLEQARRWPQVGRHILAYSDAYSIVVYQAYGREIGDFAVRNGYFGGEFNYSRMSWVKPNFLWMMYRSGWGTKRGQEVTLALKLRRAFFEALLAEAVESTYSEATYLTRTAWQDAVAQSSVRLQWDPDHDPSGAPLARRALQLGLRGDALRAFGRRELLEVLNISAFVAEQRVNATSDRLSHLMLPVEHIYIPEDEATRGRLGSVYSLHGSDGHAD